jgi:hypothetical protein
MRYCAARVVVLIVVISACEGLPRLPTAPSDLTTGVAIYEDEEFMGASALLTEDILNLQSYSGGVNARAPIRSTTRSGTTASRQSAFHQAGEP